MTVASLIDQFLASPTGKALGAQPGRQVQWWRNHLGNVALVRLDKVTIERELVRYMAEPCEVFDRASGQAKVTGRKRSPASRNRQLAALRAVFRWAMDPGEGVAPIVTTSPAHQVRNLPENNQRKTFLTRDQVITLLGLARQDQWDRCYLFILGLIHLGCRRDEWRYMEWQRVDLDQATATVPRTKNGEPLVMPLTPDIVAELRRIRALEPAITGLVFPRVDGTTKPYDHRRAWTRLKKAMGINQPLGHPDYFRLHDLRHSAASLLAADGATLAQIAEVLNHRSLQSTNRYKHLTVEGRRGLVNKTMEGLNG
jgi:integrase